MRGSVKKKALCITKNASVQMLDDHKEKEEVTNTFKPARVIKDRGESRIINRMKNKIQMLVMDDLCFHVVNYYPHTRYFAMCCMSSS